MRSPPSDVRSLYDIPFIGFKASSVGDWDLIEVQGTTRQVVRYEWVGDSVYVVGTHRQPIENTISSRAVVDPHTGELVVHSTDVSTVGSVYPYWLQEKQLLAPFEDGMSAPPGQLVGSPL